MKNKPPRSVLGTQNVKMNMDVNKCHNVYNKLCIFGNALRQLPLFLEKKGKKTTILH